MTIRRRNLILSGGSVALAAAFGVRQGQTKSYEGGNPAAPIYGDGIRKDAHTLTSFSDDVVMYREAVAHMKKLSDRDVHDPLGWAQHWLHHSMFCATSDFDRQHGTTERSSHRSLRTQKTDLSQTIS